MPTTQTREAAPKPGTAVPPADGNGGASPVPAGRGVGLAAALRPLAIDVGVPVGSYYLLHGALGMSVWLSLALSSIGPAVRAIAGLVAERRLNLLAECAARLVGAYALPVTTMVWLGTVVTIGAIGLAMMVSGTAARPMQKMIDATAAATGGCRR